MNKGLIRGGESTSHDSGNDILYTIKETKQQVLIEGDEYHLCKAALMNNEIHEYKNKTNKQILEDIYTRSSCMVKEGEANVGDFIVCKLAVRDKKKRNLTGTIAEIISIMQKEHGCRVVDGADYEKMKKGGYTSLSKTPAPKKERIYGSKRNPKGTSKSGESAKSIKFSESTLNSIKDKIAEHNKKNPEKKITLSIAKAVVRRGMGAYSSTHRPTIKGGKPNSRVAWGLARLNAFIYKVVNGKSKSGRYSQDNDLLDDLGIKHQKFEDGGEVHKMIRDGVVKLKIYETTFEHAKEYGIEAKKPLYVQNLCVSENERLKGIGKKVLNYLEDYARKNGNDVIFGYVAGKASFTKDSRQSFFCDIDMIKNWLHNNGYAINGENNDFHKVVKFADGGEININVFHGSSRKFNGFDFSKLGEATSNSTAKEGFWFTDDILTAKSYPTAENWRKVDRYIKEGKTKLAEKLENDIFENKDEKYIYNVSLSFSNPKIIDADGNVYNEFEDEIKEAIKEAKKSNNDILIVRNLSDSADYSEYLPSTHYLVFDNKVIKKINSIKEFADGGSFQPPYPINSSGGYDYKGEAKETAKKVDLLTLPKNVNGTHCGNCFFYEQGICVHKGIMLPVTDRMCCAVWDNSNSDRSYEKNIEKDKGEIPKKIKSFPKNENGGYTYSGKALEIAKKYDLITLPKKIEGTNCSNCAWFSPYKDGGFCFKSSIWLPVTARMSCASWNNLSVKRDWSLFKKGGSMKNNSEDIDTSKWEMPSKSIYRYAEKIRTEYPDIWDKGGNVFGNEAYENLERVIKRGHWLPSEEWMYKKWKSFMARHEGDFRIAGVIANLKWLNWVGKGEAYSKSLIESEIKDKKLEKKANGGEVYTEVENVKRGLRMLVGSNLFRDREYQDEFYYNGKKYYIDFVIGTDNSITEDVMMVVHRDLGGGDNDEIVLAMPFDMNKFDFNYDDFYEVFPKVEYKKLADGGSVVGKFGDFKYPEMYVPSSLYIPQTIKNQIAKKDLPKKVASFPYDFNLLDAVDVFKNIYGDESGLRDNMSAIYLLGDTIAATDAHKLCFVGLNKKQYGAYYIPKKKDYKFLMDNKEPIEKIFKADEDNLWVKNVDKESHVFYSILPRTLDFGLYEYQSKVDIQSLYRYLYFVTENNLVSKNNKQVNISYFYNQIQSIISFNAGYLIDICELYASFGLKEFYVYCSTPNKSVIFSKNALDKESFITSQLKDNLFSILMPVLNQDVPLGISNIDYEINVGIYFDLFKNKVMDEKGNPTDLTSKVSILSENEFQFIRSSFNKNYQFVKKSGSLKDLDSFLNNYAEQNGLNGTYYYDMSPKQIKLAFALSWIRPFL